MIAIQREDHSVIRVFPAQLSGRIGFHRRFGFVSEESLNSRRRLRAEAGALAVPHAEEFSFEVDRSGSELKVHGEVDCRAEKSLEGWRLISPRGVFLLEPLTSQDVRAIEWQEDSFSYRPHLFVWGSVLTFLLLLSLWPRSQKELRSAQSEDSAPVILQTKIVPLEKPQQTPPDPQAKAKQAVRQQLGFLKLVGKKEFKKIQGGLPTPAEHATAGAGPGGTEGSGGELLAGMGKGLRQATVGNTGVTGLGGIGTKGAGGGLGGYGDTAYAASGGETLSAIPLAREAKIDEGLDRSQIQSTIMRYLSQVRACYEEGLKRNQALIGQVTMGFEVGGSGMLNYSQVQRTSLSDRPVEECIRSKMMTWKFPQPRGGVNVKVSYPFMLRPLKS